MPDVIVVVQAGLVVVDENRGGDVHGVYEFQAILDPAFDDALLHINDN